MPRDQSGAYSLPVGTQAVANQLARAADINSRFSDLAAEQNLVRPLSAGGTGQTSLAALATALAGSGDLVSGSAIGVTIQAFSAVLTSIASVASVDEGAGTIGGLQIVADTNARVGVTSTGTASAYSIAAPLTTSGAYVAGERYLIKPHVVNTGGAVTLDVDGRGPVAVKTKGGTADPAGGDITTTRYIEVQHTGTQFDIIGDVQSSTTVAGLVETATPAEVQAGTAGKFIDAALLQTAIGAPQSWQAFAIPSERTNDTIYLNDTGAAIEVSVTLTNGVGSLETSTASDFSSNVVNLGQNDGTANANVISARIPSGAYYRVTAGVQIINWAELR